MKKYLILLLLTSISIFTNAQVQYLGNSNNHVVNKGAFITDSMMRLPVRDTTFPNWYFSNFKKGSIVLKNSDTSLYYNDGIKWIKLVSGYSILNFVKYSDTASMLLPYLRKNDTISLSNRIDLKLNMADTTTMLLNYANNANNGILRTGKLVQLGGNLIQNTTIAGGFDLNLNMNKVLLPKSSHFGVLNTFATANLAQFDLNATVSQVQFKNASNQNIMYIRQDGVSVWGTNNAAIKVSSTGTNSDVTGQFFVIGAPQNSATTDNGSTGGGIMLYGRGGTATTGSQSGTAIINEPFNPSSGNRTFTGLNIFNSYGQSGTATGDLAGIRYAYSGSVTGNNYGILITPTACKNGFGTAGPNSTVEINGGFALVPTIYTTSNPSIGNESISYFMTGCSGTITLPAVQNRILHLVNTSGNTLTLSSAVTNTDLTTTTSLPHTKSIVVQYLGSTYGYRIISSN